MSAYLLQRPSGWYFRITIPKDVRDYFMRRELKLLLPFADKKRAQMLAGYCAMKVTSVIISCREKNMKFGKVVISNFESKTDGTVKFDELSVDAGGDAEKEITLLKAALHSMLNGSSQETPSLGTLQKSMRLSEIVKKYCDEKTSTKAWSEKTSQEFIASYALLQMVLGDEEVGNISRENALNYLKVLQKLPPNINKKPLYRDKSIGTIIDMKPKTVLSTQSINKHMARASSLWIWARAQKYVSDNPFECLSLKKDKRPHEQRSAYNDDQLGVIFGHEIFSMQKSRHPYMYWVPLLGLFTGMRLEEICQLHVDDIRMEDEIWVIDVNNKEEKKLKTETSQRLVPIHSELIRLKFIDYCDSKRTACHKLIFSELKRERDGYSQAVSKWFGRFRKSCGIEERGLDFHSFRHTVADRLKKAGVEEKLAATILGHSAHGITYGRYAKGYLKETLRSAIEKLSYNIHL